MCKVHSPPLPVGFLLLLLRLSPLSQSLRLRRTCHSRSEKVSKRGRGAQLSSTQRSSAQRFVLFGRTLVASTIRKIDIPLYASLPLSRRKGIATIIIFYFSSFRQVRAANSVALVFSSARLACSFSCSCSYRRYWEKVLLGRQTSSYLDTAAADPFLSSSPLRGPHAHWTWMHMYSFTVI